MVQMKDLRVQPNAEDNNQKFYIDNKIKTQQYTKSEVQNFLYKYKIGSLKKTGNPNLTEDNIFGYLKMDGSTYQNENGKLDLLSLRLFGEIRTEITLPNIEGRITKGNNTKLDSNKFVENYNMPEHYHDISHSQDFSHSHQGHGQVAFTGLFGLPYDIISSDAREISEASAKQIEFKGDSGESGDSSPSEHNALEPDTLTVNYYLVAYIL